METSTTTKRRTKVIWKGKEYLIMDRLCGSDYVIIDDENSNSRIIGLHWDDVIITRRDKIMGGLFDMMDDAIAHELGVDLYTYIKIIDHKCTDEEANFIIMTIMEEDADNLEKAKEMFNKYLDE